MKTILRLLLVWMMLFTTSCDDEFQEIYDDIKKAIEEEIDKDKNKDKPPPDDSDEPDDPQAPPQRPEPPPPPFNPPPQTPSKGTGGFLWKPVSENNKKLVVILPGRLRGDVSGCTISGSFGRETGVFSGDDKNGNRPHFRFSKPGGSYGSNITVTARVIGGSDATWFIKNGAVRTEFKQ